MRLVSTTPNAHTVEAPAIVGESYPRSEGFWIVAEPTAGMRLALKAAPASVPVLLRKWSLVSGKWWRTDI